MKPNFAILVYSGGMLEKGDSKLRDYIHVDQDVPPFSWYMPSMTESVCRTRCSWRAKSRRVGGVAELHVFATGAMVMACDLPRKR